ncbi:hypothetical protein KUCAC02_013040 [Chaenocephalus aceratus]|uniref:Uncharacterized protein n=1 Tax=Chaenocephalus aceratus TaxID=36190 RepID=A0ACB9XEJ5_CHAAC|nr:hypothetical protein KUCAC02_013040 [Chaenocephalus aceratus]
MQAAQGRLADMRVVLVCALLSLLSLSHACPKECSCNGNTKVVDCRGRGLYDIPKRLHPETQELYLQDNRNQGAGIYGFQRNTSSPDSRLSNNSITTVSPTALLGLRALQRLSLAYNSLRELDKRCLGPSAHFHTLTFHTTACGVCLEPWGKVLTHLDSLTLRSNPWRCDCQLIGLKLWLETFIYKGGVVDEVICTQPEEMKNTDLQKQCNGCAYAAIMAKYQRELKKTEELAAAKGADHAKADEKELLENAIA